METTGQKSILSSPHEDKFLKAYDAHIKSIYRYIYYRTGQEKTDAEELTQEVFMRTWAYLQKDERPIEDIRAFLFQVARHVIADRWRKHKPLVALDDLDPSEEPRMEVRHEATVDMIIMEQYLLELPEKYREVLTLRYINDMTTDEAGKVLGMTANHVAVLTNRALNKLRKLLPSS
jgi:RNA polymerase sigma-70 factor (ECF subfamily)